MAAEITPARLAVRLLVYFVTLLVVTLALAYLFPGLTKYLPVGGIHTTLPWIQPEFKEGVLQIESTAMRVQAAGVLFSYLASTILLMIPISWVYMAHKAHAGFRRNFVIMLFVLPICAATAVMLIQDNLALAFGLAAMVAAVRFRVALTDALDGGFIFAGVVVGLAAGIGYVGVAVIMAVFFCFTITFLWALDYGHSPLEEEKLAQKRAKLEAGRKQSD